MPDTPKPEAQFKVSYYDWRDCNIVEHTSTLSSALIRLHASKGRVWVTIPADAPPLFGDMKNPDFVEAEAKDKYTSYRLIYKHQ